MSGATVKVALVDLLRATFAPDPAVLVTDAAPGRTAQPDVVAVLGWRNVTDGEEESYVFDLIVSCYVGGGVEAQITASLRAHVLLDAVRATLYASPTLASTCRVAALDTDLRTAEGIARDDTGQAMGRLAEISAEVTAWPGRPLIGSVESAHRVP